MAQIAVVGAGMAGVACAGVLSARGHQPSLFDRGRAPGGRMSTHRAFGGLRFDHGAQYFTARSGPFAAKLAEWCEAGVAAPWTGRFLEVLDEDSESAGNEPRFVGMPDMQAMIQYDVLAHPVRLRAIIAEARLGAGGWTLTSATGAGYGPFDALALAVPAPQAVPLLSDAPALAEQAALPGFAPCWAVMLAVRAPLAIPFDGLKLSGEPLAWAARNSAKPGRPDESHECWVLHAGPDWSREEIEREPERATVALIDAFARIVPGRDLDLSYAAAHRWRYARVETPLGEAAPFDAEHMVGLCGDWCRGARVEAAWTSGQALGEKLAAAL
jgi:renalase